MQLAGLRSSLTMLQVVDTSDAGTVGSSSNTRRNCEWFGTMNGCIAHPTHLQPERRAQPTALCCPSGKSNCICGKCLLRSFDTEIHQGDPNPPSIYCGSGDFALDMCPFLLAAVKAIQTAPV